MKKLSKKFVLAAMNGKQVVRTVFNVPTVEQRQDVIDNFTARMRAEGYTDPVVINDQTVAIGNRFCRLPNMRAIQEGTLTVRSADYYFTFKDVDDVEKSSFGSHTAVDVGADATEKNPTFTITMLNGGLLHYRLA